MIIRIDDIRKSGYCVKGAKQWFAAHGLDFKDFLKNGIDAETLCKAGDGLAQKVVAERRARDGR